MPVVSVLGWGGLASCTIAGLLALFGAAKGRQARQLSTARTLDDISELRHLWALVPVLIAVTGRVMAPKPYTCEMSDTQAAIVETREEKRSERRTGGGDAWVGASQLLRESVRETEWGLGDASGRELPVQSGQHAMGDFLQMSGDRLIPEGHRNILERMHDEVAGSRPLGVRQVERCLPVGTVLTAVGELGTAVEHPSAFKSAHRRFGKMLVLKRPRDGPFLLSRQPLPDVIASLQTTSVACNRWAAVFGSVGAAMLVAAVVQHAATWVRQRRIRQRVEKALRERRMAAAAAAASRAGGEGAAVASAGDGLQLAAAGRGSAAGGAGLAAPGAAAAGGGEDGDEEGILSGALCVVCLQRPPEMVFTSCGHLCACSGCGSTLPRCPICRSRGRPIRVYTP